MTRKRPFNKIEKQLLLIPTWWLITIVSILLAGLALLVEPEPIGKNPIKVLFDNAEAIAITSAVVLYFKEIPERKKQRHYEAWQIIDNAHDIRTSYARRKAIEDLYEDGISFYEIDLPGADLKGIKLRFANLAKANFDGAELNFADLRDTLLTCAYLKGANLTAAELSGAELNSADLRRAKLTFTNLSDITWDPGTQWPASEEVAKARNIPEKLKQKLGIE